MRTLIIFAIGLLLLIFVSCDRKREDSKCFSYPKQIDSLQIQDLYDTARLYLFTWLCDRKVDNYYRGQFELKYERFLLRNDSIELFFTHFLPKELQDTTAFSDYACRASVAFNVKTKEKLWTYDINGFSDGLEPGDARFENPATAEVLDFIRTHKQILNPCFIELAKRVKLFTE